MRWQPGGHQQGRGGSSSHPAHSRSPHQRLPGGSSHRLSPADRKPPAKIPVSVTLPRLWADHGGFRCLISGSKSFTQSSWGTSLPTQKSPQEGKPDTHFGHTRRESTVCNPQTEAVDIWQRLHVESSFSGLSTCPPSITIPCCLALWGCSHQDKGTAVNPGSREHIIPSCDKPSSLFSSTSPGAAGN